MGICCMSQGAKTGALYQPRRVGSGGEIGGRLKGRDICILKADSFMRFDRKQNSVEAVSFN